MAVGLIFPLPEVLGRLPLPIPWEIVAADVSLGGNVGAWGSGRGGWWEIKNARCRKMENARRRRHGDLMKGKFGGGVCMGVHGAAVYELWPCTGPATGYSFFPPLPETWLRFAKSYSLFVTDT